MFNPHLVVGGGDFAAFRSALVRDAACLLDVDPEVVSWQCPCEPLPFAAPENFSADIVVERDGRQEWIMVVDAPLPIHRRRIRPCVQPHVQPSCFDAEALIDLPLRVWHEADIAGIRLDNAKALLRYARWQAPLGDRVRLLALLEQEGGLPLIDCLSALRESREPMATVAVLVLHRFLDIELDLAPIGPDTRVIRRRD